MLTPARRSWVTGMVLALALVVASCATTNPSERMTSAAAGPPIAGAAVLPAAMDESDGARHLMRFADVHGDRIVFTYENDLWLVSTEGGDARRMTDDPGVEIWAKFSPDGEWIAFTGQYDGGTDVYVMPAQGGAPRRLTFHPAADRVLGWWPDGKRVLFRSTRQYPFRGEEIYTIGLEGGMPEKLPVDRAGLTAVSPDGKQIAYNRISREAATWKRYQGGMAQDIWLGSLDKGDFHKITDWVGTNNFPMWHENAIYFTSDRQYGTLNLYRHDLSTGKVSALTAYKDYDVKYPSIGPDQIIYQYGETLYLLDPKSGETRMVPVRIPSDRVPVRAEFVEVAPQTGSFNLSPSGKRLLLEARGEILNVPVKDGEPINLTKTPGAREKNSAWSPDGRWIAFLSDRTGEEEVYLVDQKGENEPRQLTSGGLGFRMHLVWSPDSKSLLFSDKFLRLNLVDAENGTLTVVDRADYDDAWERWGIQDYVWSPDSKWIAYTKQEQSMYEAIFLYSLEGKQTYRLTGDVTQDWSPSFDAKGRYLYFLSNRTFDPIMCFADQTHVFIDMARPYVVVLKKDAPSPFAPKDSEEEVKKAEAKAEEATAKEKETDKEGEKEAQESAAEKKEGKEEKKESEEKDKAEEFRIDLEGLERRMVVAEGVPAGNYFRLEATEKGFMYLKKNEHEFSKYQSVTDQTDGSLDLHHYDLEKKEAAKVLGGIANFHQSADGKTLVYRAGSTYGVVDVGAEAKVNDGKVELGGVRLKVDRPQEFLQIFNEAWRIQRDWFYDPGLHGLDWQAVGEQYRRFVPHCGNRSDLNYLIGEMIAELSIGHTYVSGGDLGDSARSVRTGMLGATFAAEPGVRYYRIAHLIPGTPGDEKERSPLEEPGCPIRVGDYLIAIDGETVTTSDDVFAFLQNKTDAVVTLTYNDKPSTEDAKKYRVRTISDERPIRYREWVEKNRTYVDQVTGGQVGYVHIPDMGEQGLIEFAKAFHPRYYKKGFILDDRYNGGGFTSDMIIDRLERKLWGLTQPREGKVLRDPERCFHGHYAVLVNEDTGSCGEFFAEAIKLRGLAPIIGMRTWGGAIGIEPHQPLVDGGSVTPPQFGLYGLERTWLIEGHGVDPDLEVQNLPGDVLKGKDAQLDAAIQLLLKNIAKNPKVIPAAPPYPDKSKPRS
ncbi:MAG: S41 family peptidase [Planctomycetota bacterium]